MEEDKWNNLIGERIKIVFDDQSKYPSTKTGELVKTTKEHIILQTNSKKEGISKKAIIRFEVK